MKKSAIILAGGLSRRLGQEKALVPLAGKPLILHVLETVSEVVDETIVVVDTNTLKANYEALLGQQARVVADKYEGQSPLIGALTGFESAGGEYTLLIPCDTPFVSGEIASFLLDVCVNKCAAIPRWPNGFIEPLQAAYKTKRAFAAAEMAINEGKLTLQAMISHLYGVRYISTVVLQHIDTKLLTFFNINVTADLKKAESIIRRGTLPKS